MGQTIVLCGLPAAEQRSNQTYGDVRTLEIYNPDMQFYLDYLTSKSEGSLLNCNLRLSAVGCDPKPDAAVLGNVADAECYAKLSQNMADAFNAWKY